MTDDFPGVDWGEAYARGTVYAERRARRFGLRLDAEQAQGVAGLAVEQIIRAGWDRSKYPSFADCLRSRINGILINRSRKKGTRNEIAAENAMPASNDPSRSPEQVLAERELAGAACTRVLERLDGNESATTVFLAMADGADTPAEIAAETGLPVGVVYRARERISAVKAQVAGELMEELGA